MTRTHGNLTDELFRSSSRAVVHCDHGDVARVLWSDRNLQPVLAWPLDHIGPMFNGGRYQDHEIWKSWPGITWGLLHPSRSLRCVGTFHPPPVLILSGRCRVCWYVLFTRFNDWKDADIRSWAPSSRCYRHRTTAIAATDKDAGELRHDLALGLGLPELVYFEAESSGLSMRLLRLWVSCYLNSIQFRAWQILIAIYSHGFRENPSVKTCDWIRPRSFPCSPWATWPGLAQVPRHSSLFPSRSVAHRKPRTGHRPCPPLCVQHSIGENMFKKNMVIIS